MIITDDSVLLNLFVGDNFYSNITLEETDKILGKYKLMNDDLKPKEMISIHDSYVYFEGDSNKNRFNIKIYKTAFGTDRWIMLMKDEYEGYALYQNPKTNKYELAWYHSMLEEPLTESEEEKIRTCYNPITNN